MRIYLAKTCGVFDYKDDIFVEDFKSDQQTKSNSIVITHRGMKIIIPLANIIAIEDKK